MSGNPLNFDKVVIVADGKRREITVESFLDLPIHVRVGLVLGRHVEFFQGFRLVDRREALRSLRQREGAAA